MSDTAISRVLKLEAMTAKVGSFSYRTKKDKARTKASYLF
jgi:hypothetical protein